MCGDLLKKMKSWGGLTSVNFCEATQNITLVLLYCPYKVILADLLPKLDRYDGKIHDVPGMGSAIYSINSFIIPGDEEEDTQDPLKQGSQSRVL